MNALCLLHLLRVTLSSVVWRLSHLFLLLLGRALLLSLLFQGGCYPKVFATGIQPPLPGALTVAEAVDKVHRVALGVLHGRMFWIVHLPIGVVLVHREAEGAIPSLLRLQVGEGRHFCFPLLAIGFICSLLGYVRRTGTLLLSTPGVSLATVTRCARELPS